MATTANQSEAVIFHSFNYPDDEQNATTLYIPIPVWRSHMSSRPHLHLRRFQGIAPALPPVPEDAAEITSGRADGQVLAVQVGGATAAKPPGTLTFLRTATKDRAVLVSVLGGELPSEVCRSKAVPRVSGVLAAAQPVPVRLWRYSEILVQGVSRRPVPSSEADTQLVPAIQR